MSRPLRPNHFAIACLLSVGCYAQRSPGVVVNCDTITQWLGSDPVDGYVLCPSVHSITVPEGEACQYELGWAPINRMTNYNTLCTELGQAYLYPLAIDEQPSCDTSTLPEAPADVYASDLTFNLMRCVDYQPYLD